MESPSYPFASDDLIEGLQQNDSVKRVRSHQGPTHVDGWDEIPDKSETGIKELNEAIAIYNVWIKEKNTTVLLTLVSKEDNLTKKAGEESEFDEYQKQRKKKSELKKSIRESVVVNPKDQTELDVVRAKLREIEDKNLSEDDKVQLFGKIKEYKSKIMEILKKYNYSSFPGRTRI